MNDLILETSIELINGQEVSIKKYKEKPKQTERIGNLFADDTFGLESEVWFNEGIPKRAIRQDE